MLNTLSTMFQCITLAVFILRPCAARYHLYDLGKNISKHCPDELVNGKHHRHSPSSLAYARRALDAYQHSRMDYDGSVPSKEFFEKYKLWPNLISSKDREGGQGEVLVGFKEMIQAIWENQNPPDCSTAKYMIEGGWEEGFGSETHIIGAGLGMAMNMKRVYLMNNLGNKNYTMNLIKLENRYGFQIDNSFCRDQGKLSLECYYEPWSKCTLKDALQGAVINDNNDKPWADIDIDSEWRKAVEEGPAAMHHFFHKHADKRIVKVRTDSALYREPFMPQSMSLIWKCSPVITNQYQRWWAAITSAYLLRPNQATLALMDKYRSSIDFDTKKDECVSVYLRRGDKHKEMRLIDDFTQFFDSAKLLWKNMVAMGRVPSSAQGTMYLASEDPTAIDAGKAWGKLNNWKILELELFDRSKIDTWLNSTMQEKLQHEKKIKHHELEYFSFVMSLDYHLRCGAYVCTYESNFCRVIDELRATVGGKANKQIIEAHCEDQKPCLDHHIQKGF